MVSLDQLPVTRTREIPVKVSAGIIFICLLAFDSIVIDLESQSKNRTNTVTRDSIANIQKKAKTIDFAVSSSAYYDVLFSLLSAFVLLFSEGQGLSPVERFPTINL